MMVLKEPCIVQGSSEWKDLRRTKVTATDAAVCMGVNPWKGIVQLYEEKVGIRPEPECNEAMQRGRDLEEPARELFEKISGITVFPRVVIKDWQMASLDGIDLDDTCLVEIKCNGKQAHALAKKNVIPVYYRCQIMHQLFLTDLQTGWYFSYRPEDEQPYVLLPVQRDDAFIEEMVQAEWYLYECMKTKTPPIPRL